MDAALSLFSSWFEIHLAALGIAAGLALAVALHLGYRRVTAIGTLAIAAGALAVWASVGWRSHPWYFALPATLTLAVTYGLYLLLDPTRF